MIIRMETLPPSASHLHWFFSSCPFLQYSWTHMKNYTNERKKICNETTRKLLFFHHQPTRKKNGTLFSSLLTPIYISCLAFRDVMYMKLAFLSSLEFLVLAFIYFFADRKMILSLSIHPSSLLLCRWKEENEGKFKFFFSSSLEDYNSLCALPYGPSKNKKRRKSDKKMMKNWIKMTHRRAERRKIIVDVRSGLFSVCFFHCFIIFFLLLLVLV
jgi:hypothetical protein